MPPGQRDLFVNTIAQNSRLARVGDIVSGPAMCCRITGNCCGRLVMPNTIWMSPRWTWTSLTRKIDVTDAALQDYFNKNQQAFQRPPQVSLSYVKFPAAVVPDPTPDQLHTFLTDHKDQFADLKPEDLANKDKATPVAAGLEKGPAIRRRRQSRRSGDGL